MDFQNDFSVFDIEANNWKDFLILGYYDETIYRTFRTVKDFINYYCTNPNTPSVCYAHFGGIYDFLFIIDCIFSQNSKVSIIENIILQGRKILKFDVRYGKIRKTFIDSSGLFPFGLEKLTHSFDVEHKKLKDNVDFSKKIKITKKLLKYLEHDCKGLYECLEKFSNMPYIKGHKLALTRSGQSFRVFKKHFCNNPLPNISDQVKQFARCAYFGGRTEIFKPLHINKRRPLNVYDINSLYPSVMHDFEYPSIFIGWSTDLQLDTFSICHVTVLAPKKLVIPLLGIQHNGKFIFPLGTFQGYFTNVELDYAIKLGYRIIKVHRVALFDNGGLIFRDFVAHFYERRKITNDPVEKILFKDLMNHLYGRLAINEVREQISFTGGEGKKIHSVLDYGKYEIRLYSHEKRIYTYSNPVLSCFVTSYARLRLYRYMEQVKFDVHYCDTDSLFTTKKLPDSKELGEMKLEYQLKEACFLLPKSYGGNKLDGSFILKLKGFRNSGTNMNHIDFSTLCETLSGEIRLPPVKTSGGLAGIKTALKKNEILHVLPDSQKQLKAVYDKRIIYKQGKEYKTRPITLGD